MGTLNHFSKDLGIPTAIEDAVKTISSFQIKEVDAGEVNGKLFLNNSSIGLYPGIVHQREKGQKLGYGKWRAFIRASLRVVKRYPLVRVSLKAGDQQLTLRTPFVFVG